MRGTIKALSAVFLQLLAAGPVWSADLGAATPPYCAEHESISLLVEDDTAVLKAEVARLMNEAIAVSRDQHWIYSGRPVFVWANEAKYSCGKAYGYLKASYRDEQNLNNCGCAYSRMQSYMQ